MYFHYCHQCRKQFFLAHGHHTKDKTRECNIYEAHASPAIHFYKLLYALNVPTSIETTTCSAATPAVMKLSARPDQLSSVSLHAENPDSFYVAVSMLLAEPSIEIIM